MIETIIGIALGMVIWKIIEAIAIKVRKKLIRHHVEFYWIGIEFVYKLG